MMERYEFRDNRRNHPGRDDGGRQEDPRPKAPRQGDCAGTVAERRDTNGGVCTGMRRTASVGRKSNARGISTRQRRERKRPSGRAFVVCVNNTEYPASLELHKIYRVVPDQEAAREGDLRVVDESGEDYLYPAKWFVPVELPRRVKTSLLRTA